MEGVERPERSQMDQSSNGQSLFIQNK